MPKKRFQPQEIIGKLRHADVPLGQGKVAEVVKALAYRPPAPESRAAHRRSAAPSRTGVRS